MVDVMVALTEHEEHEGNPEDDLTQHEEREGNPEDDLYPLRQEDIHYPKRNVENEDCQK